MDIDDARLRLACLKENFEYRRFFLEFKRQKENAIKEGKRVWPAHGFERFGINESGLFCYPAYEFITEGLDPYQEPEKNIDEYLPTLFRERAVIQVEPEFTLPAENVASSWLDTQGPAPWERLYLVDLQNPKSQILAEIGEYIDAALQKPTDWKAHQTRRRKEAWRHLEAWKLRKKRIPFSVIARRLDVTEAVAYKSFGRAFELTQGRRYDPEQFRREAFSLPKEALQRTCDTCPDRATCTTLCPDVMVFIDQDHVKRKEMLSPY